MKFLKKEGFDVVSQSGSHVKLNGPNGEIELFLCMEIRVCLLELLTVSKSKQVTNQGVENET